MPYYKKFEYSSPPGPEHDPVIANNPVEAISEVTVFFGLLEECLAIGIEFVLRRGDRVARVISSELSFRQQLAILALLVRELAPSGADLEPLDELCAICSKAEQLRNQVAHSSWVHGQGSKSMIRRKSTAKVKEGLKDHEETLHVWQIMDIASYIEYVVGCVDALMVSVFGQEYET